MACGQAIDRFHMEDGGGGEKLDVASTQIGPPPTARVSQLRQICILMNAYYYLQCFLCGGIQLCMPSEVWPELHCVTSTKVQTENSSQDVSQLAIAALAIAF